MKCKACGKDTIMNVKGKCVDFYIGENLPTKVKRVPWVYIDNLRAEKAKMESSIDEELALNVMVGKYEFDRDESAIKIGEIIVPFNVKALGDLAMKTRYSLESG